MMTASAHINFPAELAFTPVTRETLRPLHIVAGLGGAEREVLASCLALFDEASLGSHLSRIYDKTKGHVRQLTSGELVQVADKVQHRQGHWLGSSLSDEHLRLMLWAQLRSALQLPPRLTGSLCGAEQLADDVSAAMISLLSPPPGTLEAGKDWLRERGVLKQDDSNAIDTVSLQAVVEPVLQELLEAALTGGVDTKSGQSAIDQAVAAMQTLSPEDQDRLREELGVDELNAAALAKVLATGGGLALFSGAVSMAGFSAYILAAQVSAFVPLVSGPGLVSLVAVVSNPIAVVAVTGTAAWWLGSSANQKIRAAVATRIVAMLAIQGMASGRPGLESAISAFASAANLPANTGLSSELVTAYREEWQLIGSDVEPDHNLTGLRWKSMEWPLSTAAVIGGDSAKELGNASALGVLTVGDMLYAAAQISPDAIAAADFSYLADIDGPIDFALLASGMGDGAAVRLKGYMAEQVVAAKLQAAGHVVSFPGSASEPGWDLLIDGQRVQVKFHSDIDGIREHFEKYDYPVIANTELMGQIPEEFADQVYFVEGVSNELVTSVTDMSVEAGQALADPDVPALAFAITAYRSARGLCEGELTGPQAVEQVLMDGTVRVGLAISGQWAGVGVGLLLFGPAGAWILGAGLPILAQSQTSRIVGEVKARVRLPERKRWSELSHKLLDALQAAGINSLELRTEQLDRICNSIGTSWPADYIAYRIGDRRQFANECIRRQKSIDSNSITLPEQRAAATLRWLAVSDIHPLAYQTELAKLTGCLKAQPGLKDELHTEEVQATVEQAKEYGRRVFNEGLAVSEKIGRWLRKGNADGEG